MEAFFKDIIVNFGFPVALSAYLLFVNGKQIEKHGERMDSFKKDMTEAIAGNPLTNKRGLIQAVDENTRTTKWLTQAVKTLIKKK